jgi:magnesium-protoporphyrin IX monomethyl ester (oxidative) cyclase
LGVDPDWYAHEVFTKTSKLSKQIFPITLDIDHPRWKKGLLSIQKANQDLADAKAKGSKLAQLTSSIRAGFAFVMLFTVPSKKHSVPSVTRLEPAY